MYNKRVCVPLYFRYNLSTKIFILVQGKVTNMAKLGNPTTSKDYFRVKTGFKVKVRIGLRLE